MKEQMYFHQDVRGPHTHKRKNCVTLGKNRLKIKEKVEILAHELFFSKTRKSAEKSNSHTPVSCWGDFRGDAYWPYWQLHLNSTHLL